MTERRSDLFWSRYLAGELGWLERWQLARDLRRSDDLRAERDRLVAERAAFDAAPERAGEIGALAARAAGGAAPTTTAHRGRWALFVLPAAAAAAGLALFFSLRPAPDTLTAKGGDLFVLHVHQQTGSVPLGAVCRPGEALRAQYRTDRRYLLIAGQDASGEVQTLFPMGGVESALLSQGEGLTPGSWILDDTPGEERFVALFSDRPLAASEIEGLLRSDPDTLADLPGVTVVEQRCRKETP